MIDYAHGHRATSVNPSLDDPFGPVFRF